MSIVPSSVVKTHAETIGLTNLSDELLSALAQDVEYRVREIIQDATKYMLHAKRLKLSVDDINMALQARNAEPLYGYDPTEALSFRMVPNTSLFYVPNEEVDLEAVLQETLPKAPQPTVITSHWLAIEGVQPQIPENPIIHDKTPQSDVRDLAEPGTGPSSKKEVLEDAEVKPLVKHVLSKELQLYYDTVISDLMANDRNSIQAALLALRDDAGIQQLLPYFIQFIAEMVPKNLRVLKRLKILMQATKALLANRHLFIEPYLHQTMPPVLTCLVGKRLCENAEEDHWSLRVLAAEIVYNICSVYGEAYNTLIPRVTKTLARAMSDAQKPLSTHFGAIVGITALGPTVIDAILIPNLRAYLEALRPELRHEMSDAEPMQRLEVGKCYEALLVAVRRWMRANPCEAQSVSGDDPNTKVLQAKYADFAELFGDDLGGNGKS